MNNTNSPFNWQNLAAEVEKDLLENILPFWLQYAPDPQNGGFYGAVSNDLIPNTSVPRSVILCSRILWTFAAASRCYPNEAYRKMADYAYAYLLNTFKDTRDGGFFWTVDATGQPVNSDKYSYMQAFIIYSLAEYYRITREEQVLDEAQELFKLVDKNFYDRNDGGYFEGASRDWVNPSEASFHHAEGFKKSMNTLLHIMEAFTNLLRIWPDPLLSKRQQELIEIFFDYVFDKGTGHFRLFFDEAWHSLSDHQSFGHDIEGSWLLVEAAEIAQNKALLSRSQEVALQMAQAVLEDGLAPDGSLFDEKTPQGLKHTDRIWWIQAEGVVGFVNAYQFSERPEFARAAFQLWDYIKNYFIDRRHGDWFKRLDEYGRPVQSEEKIGPWNCPYHHSRMGLELKERLRKLV